VDEFVARENVRRFRGQLKSCTDKQQKAVLELLLAEHEQYLAEMEGRAVAPKSSVHAPSAS
jgi:hypothetical protein